MSDNRFDDDYQGFEKPDIMDKIGDSFSSIFPRRSQSKIDKDDELLFEFKSSSSDDDYELFVDEHAQQKKLRKQQKEERPKAREKKVKKPVTPLVRRIRNIITSCAIVAVVLIVCVILSLTVLFKTQAYEVTGNTRYDESEVISTCGITKSDNIFLANKRAAEKRLLKTYPYVEQAKVSFAIPDTITIDITEAVPAYAVKLSDSQYFVASSKGRILEQVESIDKLKLPLFLGGELKNATVGEYVEFSDKSTLDIIDEIVTVFTDNGYTGITEIDATDNANITFTYDNRIKVKLGLPEDINYKVRTAMIIIVEKLDPNGSKSTAGELDVANCNDTKKSYFREQSLIDSQQKTDSDSSYEDFLNESDDSDDTDTNEDTQQATEKPLSPDDWYLD